MAPRSTDSLNTDTSIQFGGFHLSLPSIASFDIDGILFVVGSQGNKKIVRKVPRARTQMVRGDPLSTFGFLLKSFFLKCIVNGEALNNGAGLCLDLIRLLFEHVRDQVRTMK